jgi:hypothetical protein
MSNAVDPLAALGDLRGEDDEARKLVAAGVDAGPGVEGEFMDGRPMSGAPGEVPPATRPDLPMYDEHAMPVVYYDCWRCKRRNYMAEVTYDTYRIRSLRPFCLPCQSPDMFKWRQDADTGREYLQPLQAAIGRGTRPGEREAQRLDGLLAERSEKRERKLVLVDILERVQIELGGVEARLRELEAEVKLAQDEFDTAQRDPNRADKIRAEILLIKYAKEKRKLAIMEHNADAARTRNAKRV